MFPSAPPLNFLLPSSLSSHTSPREKEIREEKALTGEEDRVARHCHAMPNRVTGCRLRLLFAPCHCPIAELLHVRSCAVIVVAVPSMAPEPAPRRRVVVRGKGRRDDKEREELQPPCLVSDVAELRPPPFLPPLKPRSPSSLSARERKRARGREGRDRGEERCSAMHRCRSGLHRRGCGRWKLPREPLSSELPLKARREEQIQAAHDEAMFGTSALPPPTSTDSDPERENEKEVDKKAVVTSLLSETVSGFTADLCG
ncbi:hypothetical protein Ahy_B09g095307 isoform A [Arachis hypogaea]|uniref:Uncharacterized protein n=1 Tax=Arachis hypogaea TaxID=3818 RepID=A0A444XDT4_ARAHY|nr:hypothetical protein Ahy_B09g095307 isoform A [Arachis hypogaea]